MAVSGLSARSEFVYPERSRPRDRRAAAEPSPEPRPAAAPAGDFDPGLAAASYAARFTADLYTLSEFAAAQTDERADDPPSTDGYVDTLRALVLAVRAGDMDGARAAAEALEHEERFAADSGPPAVASANGATYEALFDLIDEDPPATPQP